MTYDAVSHPFEQSVTFLYAAQLDRTHRFYTEVLGLEMVLDQGACRIYRVAQQAFLGFCSHRKPTAQEGVIITLVRHDVEKAYQDLLSKGVSFEVPLRYNDRFDITQAFFRDPDGYLLELQRFDSPDWPMP